jgi:hypothetical protein
MDRTLLFLIITFFISACRSISYFETPNAVRNLPATLYLANGRSYHGDLSVHTNRHSKSAVKLYTEGDKKPMRLGLHHVRGYQLKNDYYELKEIKGNLSFFKEYSFMKRLTKEDSKVHLYEHTKKITQSGGKHTSAYTRYETEHYLQLPDEDNAVWPLNGSKFVPDFHQKMSKLFGDCPTLASKISNKENGYFYSQVSLIKEKRTAVLLNIIEEYNNCN